MEIGGVEKERRDKETTFGLLGCAYRESRTGMKELNVYAIKAIDRSIDERLSEGMY